MATKKQQQPSKLVGPGKEFLTQTHYLRYMRNLSKEIIAKQTEFTRFCGDLPKAVQIKAALSRSYAEKARTEGSKVWGKA